MATSPGPRGGSSVLEIAKPFSLSRCRCKRKLFFTKFCENFDEKRG
jgi:hypothetical protein